MHILGKCSTTVPHFQPSLTFSLEAGFHQIAQASFEVTVTQSGLELVILLPQFPEYLGLQACTT